LYERVAEVERVKLELRAMNLNPTHKKRKGVELGAPSESVNQNMKKLAFAPPRNRPESPVEPCRKCRRTNHTTLECRVGNNKCLWCGSPDHFIAACP